jgi:hypothetical protein
MDLKETICGRGLESAGSRQCPVADSCEHGNEPAGSKKYREFIGQLSEYQFLREHTVPWSVTEIK